MILIKRRRIFAANGLILALFLSLAFFVGSASAVEECIIDQQGADDEPGQKDLNALCQDVEPDPPADLTARIFWDQDGWTGNNTGDACILFDTDADNNANYALCEVVTGTPAVHLESRLYRCVVDSWTSRCFGAELMPAMQTSCTAATVPGADPFHPGEADTVADCVIVFSDFDGATAATLLDICSFPSQEPNSDPSDCVISPTDPTAITSSRATAGAADLLGTAILGAFAALFLATGAAGVYFVRMQQ
ncbi:MAG: hypothetical protein ACRDHL_05405, partial [Candidatus Promineifilaceae bacterium]